MSDFGGPPAEVLNAKTADDVLGIMDNWARQGLAGSSLYRALICPVSPSRGVIEIGDDVLALLKAPPQTRRGGWCIWNLSVKGIQSGVVGTSSGGHRVVLLTNGYMEFRHPARDEGSFQWRQSEHEGQEHPWLYPYPVIEFPMNFYELAHRVYQTQGFDASCVAQHCYYNIEGFSLRPGHPSSIHFNFDQRVFHEQDFTSSKVPVRDASDFDVDGLVHELVQELYGTFGHTPDQIPLFDEDGRFQP